MKITKLEDITPNTVSFDEIYNIPVSDIGYVDDTGNIVFTGFHINQLNRATDNGHINQIKNCITSDNIKYFSPTEVNINTMNILDGQHRISSFIKLNRDNASIDHIRVIFYDIDPDKELEFVKAKNTNNKNWTSKNFVTSNCKAGNSPELNTLQDFCTRHDRCHKTKKDGSIGSLNLNYGAALLWGFTPSKEMRTGVFGKNLTLTKRKVEAAEERYRDVDMLISALGYNKTSTWYQRLCQAWYQLKMDPECCERIKIIGMESIKSNIHNSPMSQQSTQASEWYDYLYTVGLGFGSAE